MLEGISSDLKFWPNFDGMSVREVGIGILSFFPFETARCAAVSTNAEFDSIWQDGLS